MIDSKYSDSQTLRIRFFLIILGAIKKQIAALSNARVIHENGHLDKVIRHAFAADLMSDVLRLDTSEMILITGLANLQVIRTAEMSDISFILFVRGKQASPDMVELAKECNIAILQSKQSMFKVCGLLYEAGLEPIY